MERKKKGQLFFMNHTQNIKNIIAIERIPWCRKKNKYKQRNIKKFEETLRLNVEDLIIHFQEKPPKGEFVFIIEGKK